MSTNIGRFPEVHDFVGVSVKQVMYYGYVDDVAYDMRCPSVTIEFYPGCRRSFNFDEIKFFDYPKSPND